MEQKNNRKEDICFVISKWGGATNTAWMFSLFQTECEDIHTTRRTNGKENEENLHIRLNFEWEMGQKITPQQRLREGIRDERDTTEQARTIAEEDISTKRTRGTAKQRNNLCSWDLETQTREEMDFYQGDSISERILDQNYSTKAKILGLVVFNGREEGLPPPRPLLFGICKGTSKPQKRRAQMDSSEGM